MGERLKLLPHQAYAPEQEETDPLRFYYWPILGPLYRQRVELALNECQGGECILEVGYGSGITFLNLSEKYKQIFGIDLFADAELNTKFWNKHGLSPTLRRGDLLRLPYPDNTFDTVLLISILEHIQVAQQPVAMREIHRVLKKGGQMVYGVPVERSLMAAVFKVLGVKIREHHFSTENDVAQAAQAVFTKKRIVPMKSSIPFIGPIYEVGNFIKHRP
ncbi:MAG: class I SAM-dependent methyltransferase [Anaerolineales bacterium]